jgi:asparagine synthase (glutamine-hydrolysing)
MCGISGCFGFSDGGSLDRVKVMNSSMRHRGPDASGSFLVSPEIGSIGHVRLSIVDVSERSNQPFKNADGSVYLCFNGEIINAKKLKSGLRYEFITESDTEVVLAGYLQEGDSFFQKMNGMFAILLVDLRLNKIKLVRDCFGVKPLWYALNNGALAISSEEAAFEKIGWSLKNGDYGKWFLGFRYLPTSKGYLFHSRKVMPGTICEWNIQASYDEPEVREFMRAFSPPESQDLKEPNNNLREELDWRFTNAIMEWSVSDVPITSFLSSGIDSALVVDGLHRSGHDITAYTACFDVQGYSEEDAVKKFCSRRSIRSYVKTIDQDSFLDAFHKYSTFRKGAVGVANEVAIAVLTEKVAEKYKVVFSGEGADELFGGYGRLFRAPEEFSHSQENFVVSDEFIEGFIRKYNYVQGTSSWSIFGWQKEEVELEFAQFAKERMRSRHAHEWVFEFFQEIHLPGLLERLDFATMNASVEGRPVFLHQDLWHWVNRCVPRSLKLKWKDDASKHVGRPAAEYSGIHDSPKYLLRELAQMRLSREESRINKIGFPVPVRKWIQNGNALKIDGASDAEFWLVNNLKNIL